VKVGLITIGNELLSGFTTDTNAAWIGQQISKIGAEVIWHITVPDSKEDITQALISVPKDIHVLLITGGLGPTHDDITANVLYSWAGIKTEFDEEYWQDLEKRFATRNVTIPQINKNQALKPASGNMIPNPVGSARGIHINKDGKEVIAMPGVPAEMKALMTDTVLPIIAEKITEPVHIHTFRTTGIMESSLAEKLEPVLMDSKVKLAFLPKIFGVDIRISSTDEHALSGLIDDIYNSVGKYIYSDDDLVLEEAVGKLLISKNLTIASAESCTGGLIATRLTNVPGSSDYFIGGMTAYQNEVKLAEIGVQKETLESHGAVSEETAVEMAKGIQSKLKADLGISSTGIAGPGGGTEEKPVGLVYIALAHKDGVMSKKFNLTKDRMINKNLTSQAALNMIRIYLNRE
jgi:nicotinamide-nucleotide amidase